VQSSATALALDNVDSDRLLARLFRLECSLIGDGNRVLRGMRMPCGDAASRDRFYGAQAVRIDVADFESRRLARLLGENQRGVQRRAVGNRSSAATESSGSLPESWRSMSRTIGMRVDPPASSTRSSPAQSRPLPSTFGSS